MKWLEAIEQMFDEYYEEVPDEWKEGQVISNHAVARSSCLFGGAQTKATGKGCGNLKGDSGVKMKSLT